MRARGWRTRGARNRTITVRSSREILNSGYSNHGANTSKAANRGYITDSKDACHDIDNNFKMLRARSVDLQQGVPIAAGALKTNKTNVIGPGLKLKANIRFEALGLTVDQKNEWERNTEQEFAMWARNCDARQQTDFYGLQALVFFEKMLYGDAFVNLPMIQHRKDPYYLRLQVIESLLVATPPKYQGREEEKDNDIIHGVKFGKYGEAVGYYVLTAPYTGYNQDEDFTYIKKYGEKTGRRNIVHVLNIERSGQIRGVPLLAPVIEDIKLLGRYTDAEVVKVLVNALMSVFIETPTPDEGPPIDGIDYAEQVDTEHEDTIELGNGTINVLGPGETVKTVEKSPIPSDFDNFVTALISQIGAALEIPYEILIKHFSSSYSASRGALLEYWKSVDAARSEFITQFCNPIYEEWLTEAITLGRISAPGFFDDPAKREAWLGAEWYGPAQGQLNPKDEAEAANIRVKSGMSTLAREAAQITGMDFENEILPQRIREHEAMDEGGLLLEQGQQINVGGANAGQSDGDSAGD
ncbi:MULTISPECIES: phage portal protein [Veillonella]|uniref:phage portal protein n=1 Tax=Veillonella TaxID=29465 RepID=UPI001D03A73C|nr:phage portal protein [Veillonella ratti]MCB5743539.1 phage portal protein [Veillonella ratti]MCB5757515.1 phage portal protein [Veillonella ratti]MCB5759817.1 phage portal protein [Veillonella ratti]MCB5762113.1 phage portal protein [Veillonella ratti]MCB5782492.1 phage portal protein [Veillonella ratti]